MYLDIDSAGSYRAGPPGGSPDRGMTEAVGNHDLRRSFIMMVVCFGCGRLRAHQTRMDVIGNNIANVNTVGFKAAGNISGCLYQTMSSGSAASDTRGTNPKQVGIGMTSVPLRSRSRERSAYRDRRIR